MQSMIILKYKLKMMILQSSPWKELRSLIIKPMAPIHLFSFNLPILFKNNPNLNFIYSFILSVCNFSSTSVYVKMIGVLGTAN